MGAYDTLAAAKMPCPSCGHLYWDSCQTKFFAPDYDDQGYLHPGEGRTLDFDPAEIASSELWNTEWLRIGEAARSDGFTLLMGDWDQRTCFCDAVLIPVARISVESTGPHRGTMTLDALELWDLRDNAHLAGIDFADSDWFRIGPSLTGSYANLGELATLPRHARRERFAEAIASRIAPSTPDGTSDHDGWSCVQGPVRCEACNRSRVVNDHFFVTHPKEGRFFGDAWCGGELTIGSRVGPIAPIPADERVRGRYYRLRDPVPTELTFLGARASYSCFCDAGRVSLCIRFRRDGEYVVLAELTWRVVQGRADLADIDWIETSSTGYLRRTDISDDDRVHAILAERQISEAPAS